jgi:type IV secretion system protein VirB4
MRAAGAGQSPLADLLPWLCLYGKDLVLCKDGSLLACLDVAGLDSDALDADEASRLSGRVEGALRALDERCTLWSIFERRRNRTYPPGEFPHPLTARIDALHARRFRAGEQFVNRHVLALLFTPGSHDGSWQGLLDAFRRVRQSGWARPSRGQQRSSPVDQTWAQLAAHRHVLEALLEAFMTALQDLGLRRMGGAELLGFLNACASPTRDPSPIRPPGQALTLDALLGEDRLTVGAEVLRFDGSAGSRRVAALGIKAWPDSTVPGLIEALLRVPVQLSLVQVFRCVSGETAKAHIQSVQRFHLNLQRSAFSFVREAVFGEASQVVDGTRAVAADEAREALQDLAGHRQLYGYFNLSVLVAAEPGEDLDAALRSCAAAVREAGFLVLREGMHLLSAWSGALPGQWGQLVRWHFIHTGNLSDLLPLQMAGHGRLDNPYLSEQLGQACAALAWLPGRDRTTFHFNFHCQDLGHCLVVGPSRSGKSVLMNFLLAQFLRYPRARVIVFDKDRSCRIPTLLQGGQWSDPGTPGSVRCNPLAEVDSPDGRAWLQAWLRRLLCLRGHHWQGSDETVLAQALDAMSLLPLDQQRLAGLQVLLPPALSLQLAPWVAQGPLAYLFDHAEGALGLGRLSCIEMGQILRDEELAKLFMDYAIRRIDALLAASPPAPTAIYIEEAWFMLGDPGFRERIRDWLKTLPKRLALVILATQSLDDLSGSPVFSAIADNIPTRIFLANRNAPMQAALYQGQFGLNAAQLTGIARAEPKRQFLVVNPRQSRFIDLALPDEVVKLLRSDRRAQQAFDRVQALPPEQRIEAYLDALSEANDAT